MFEMGRPIAGQYHVPVKDGHAWALIDAEHRTMRVGPKVYGKPEILHTRPRNLKLSKDSFWRILGHGDPLHVEEWLAQAHIMLKIPYNGRRVIRMNLLAIDEPAVTVRA